MMRDKVGIQEKMSFVLNGKPITPGEDAVQIPPPPIVGERQLICSKCGVDRLKEPCPTPDLLTCPISFKAQ